MIFRGLFYFDSLVASFHPAYENRRDWMKIDDETRGRMIILLLER